MRQYDKQHIESLIIKGRLKNVFELLKLRREEKYIDEILMLESRYNDLCKNKMSGVLSSETEVIERNKIIQGLIQLKNEILANEISVKSNTYSFEFDFMSNQWKPLSVASTDSRKDELKARKKIQENGISYILGLPQTGRTTLLKRSLHQLSKDQEKPTLLINLEKLRKSDYKNILKRKPYHNDILNDKILLGVDDYDNASYQDLITEEFENVIFVSNDIKRHSSTFRVDEIYNKPFSREELLNLISKELDKEGAFVPLNLKEYIFHQSGGIPELAREILHFYLERKDISTVSLYSKLANMNRFMNNLNDISREENNVLSEVFALKKSIQDFYMYFTLSDSLYYYFQNLGIDQIIKSDIINYQFLNLSDQLGRVEILRDRIINDKKLSQGTSIWTPDMHLKRIRHNDLDVLEYIKGNLKGVEKRIRKVYVNNIEVTLNNKLKNGDILRVEIGRSDQSLLNMIDPVYKKLSNQPERRKEQRGLIKRADKASKNGDFVLAEKLYLKSRKIKTESDWANVRIANLYRFLGRYEEAEKICDKIIRSSTNAHALLCKGILTHYKGAIAESYSCFKSALAIKSNYVNATIWKCRCLLQLRHDYIQVSNILTELKVNRLKFRRNSKVTLDENILWWFTLLSLGEDNAFHRMKKNIGSRIKTEIESFSKTDHIKTFLPLAYLFFFLTQDAESLKMRYKEAKQIIDKFDSVKMDLFYWLEIVPWLRFEGIDKDDFVQSFLL